MLLLLLLLLLLSRSEKWVLVHGVARLLVKHMTTRRKHKRPLFIAYIDSISVGGKGLALMGSTQNVTYVSEHGGN
jgi:hypothetical protein